VEEKAVIFDLDGTLIDSLEDIAICANKVLKEFNLPTHGLKEYKNFVGKGILSLIKDCSTGDTSKINQIFQRFKMVYSQALCNNTKPYAGVYKMMEKLHKANYKIGIDSNKPHEFTLKCVKHFFQEFNLKEVYGQKENTPKKPHPQVAQNIAKAFNISCENIFFVGDSDVDMQTAKNAGMIPVGVSWGFRGTKELIENGACHILQSPKDILNLLKKF